jgi:DNA primase catalytic core
MRIPIEFVQLLREASSIVDVVGGHVKLRKAGVELVGRCPFHEDHTPSFYVHPDKQFFRCHGCQAGGDVFAFIRLLNKCSFREAVSHLAARAGIKLDGFRASPELTAGVQSIKAQRDDELAFKRFCDERIEMINRQHRSLSRAATHAEDYLRAGDSDPYLHDLAWSAFERFRTFEASIEREGLCDPDVLRSAWEELRRDAA